MMAKSRPVTERDLRMEEFRWLEAEDLEHLEIREDGKIVRKDRWENGIQSIRIALGDTRKEFEIPEIVSAVRALVRSIPVPAEESESDREILQRLCTLAAQHVPVPHEWSSDKTPRPWGCILTRPSPGYCDDCPVSDDCPYPHKEWSK